jgi:hypothetical protein
LRLKKDAYNGLTQVLQWALIISSFIIYLAKIAIDVPYFLSISLYFTAIFLIGEYAMVKPKPIYLKAPKLIGIIGNIVMLYITAFVSIRDLIGRTWDANPAIFMSIFGGLAILIAGFLAYKLYKTSEQGTLKTIMIGGTYVWKAITAAIGNTSESAATIMLFLSNCYLLCWGIIMIVSGWRERNPGQSTIGTAVTAMWILLRFFMTDINFFVRGLAFIVIGAAFLGANLILSKRIKQEKEAESHVEDDRP